ncbi:L,D-transpeptidase [Schlegelella sp. S2-27]|uniref:L,D-transpeptidase n=1 Tax=Caldimonas mangrovi TaxID=2944811 RepID=A0ABT0YS25_9BURK|nr:L,D-transpeptidase [Caldimonas mangrovi]MCM5681209.1 L,D-transpeptidase [Caldimonas mangrovi]
MPAFHFLRATFAACTLTFAAAVHPAPDAALSTDAQQALHWVQQSGDAQGRPFAVVDKKAAVLFVFSARGQLVGATPALLGLAPGDHTVPGIGARPLSQIKPHERTTPAGRFASEPGLNISGEHVVWVDYDSGFAIHRLRPGASLARRERQLATPTPKDNRASFGCVVVPGTFYDAVVRPVLGSRHGMVYVLPETRSAASWLKAPQAADGL